MSDNPQEEQEEQEVETRPGVPLYQKYLQQTSMPWRTINNSTLLNPLIQEKYPPPPLPHQKVNVPNQPSVDDLVQKYSQQETLRSSQKLGEVMQRSTLRKISGAQATFQAQLGSPLEAYGYPNGVGRPWEGAWRGHGLSGGIMPFRGQQGMTQVAPHMSGPYGMLDWPGSGYEGRPGVNSFGPYGLQHQDWHQHHVHKIGPRQLKMLHTKQINEIHNLLKNRDIYWRAKKLVFKKLKAQNMEPSDIKNGISKIAQSIKIEEKLKEIIRSVASEKKYIIPQLPKELDHIAKVRQDFTEFVFKKVQEYNLDYGKPFIKKKQKLRPSQLKAQETQDYRKRQDSQFQFIHMYNYEDLFKFLIKVKSNNQAKGIHPGRSINLLKLKMNIPNYKSLQKKYSIIEEDDLNVDFNSDNRHFQIEKIDEAKKLINQGFGLRHDLQKFAQKGVPASIRREFYLNVFGIEDVDKEAKYINKIIYPLLNKYEYLLDDFTKDDCWKLCDNTTYFLFQQDLLKGVQCILRDKKFQERCKCFPHEPLKVAENQNKIFPDCGFIPGQHFGLLFVPFFYLSRKVFDFFYDLRLFQFEEIYIIFREFYCKYLCYLQSLTSHKNGILNLCLIFENLLQEQDPSVFKFCVKKGIHPLKIALPWMYFCFANNFNIKEVFFILDRIVGYDSTEVLAILSAALFQYKKHEILECEDANEIKECFEDLTEFEFLDVIQNFMFRVEMA